MGIEDLLEPRPSGVVQASGLCSLRTSREGLAVPFSGMALGLRDRPSLPAQRVTEPQLVPEPGLQINCKKKEGKERAAK